MSNNRADVNPLIGRYFVTTSGNVCRIERMAAEGAMRAVWSRSQSKTTIGDYEELNAWIKSVLGTGLNITENRDGGAKEAESFAQWKLWTK